MNKYDKRIKDIIDSQVDLTTRLYSMPSNEYTLIILKLNINIITLTDILLDLTRGKGN